MLLSASTGSGCDELLSMIDARLAEGRRIIDVTIDLSDGATMAWLYSHGEVLERVDDQNSCRLKVGLNPENAARFANRGAGPPA